MILVGENRDFSIFLLLALKHDYTSQVHTSMMFLFAASGRGRPKSQEGVSEQLGDCTHILPKGTT